MGFLRHLFGLDDKPTATPVALPAPRRASSFFTSDLTPEPMDRMAVLDEVRDRSLRVTPAHFRLSSGMDSAVSGSVFESAKSAFALADANVPDAQALWYASQGFIGFQLCAILAQQWLVNKACFVPARDAIRNGFRITGQNLAPELRAKIEAADKRFGLKRQIVEAVHFKRVFGIRVVIFRVDSPDPQYYERPFNADGVTPGSYRGMVQVDPYWCIPELSQDGASNPTSAEFYEPTYWTIQGKRYHRSHLVVLRGPEVADLLKPSYLYAGLSVPQMIYERVYAAERTANEGPQLALTKRAMVFYTNTEKALSNVRGFMDKLSTWASFRDNYGVKVADKEGDQIEQHDTALGDFDSVVMTQYQLVAAIANMPATKLLGTTPKGFNSSGDYEEANYHEELENIQTSDAEPIVNRHHLLLMRSEIAPAAGIAPVNVGIDWNALDAPTDKEKSDAFKTRADAVKSLAETGALDGQDVRTWLLAQPEAGFTGLGLAPAVPDDAAPHLPGGPAPAPGGDALDASDWNPVTGEYAEAELITNQDYLDPETVAAKIAAQDFTVQLSPEFTTATGKRYRVIIDGHHSLAAALQSGACPVFVQANYGASDYVNAVTKLPMAGAEMEASE